MRLITTLTGTKISIFSEAKETPIRRYNEFQKHCIIQSGIGHTIQDIDSRYAKVAAFIADDKKQEALKELENARYAIASSMEQINYEAYSFACLVDEIDGVKYDDLTEDGLSLVIIKLMESQITQFDIEEAVLEVKKK